MSNQIFNVQLKKNKRHFECSENDSILEGGLRHGLSMHYECSNGTCGACIAKLVNGDVKQIQHHDFVLTEDQKKQGEFLMCCNTPVSDVALELELIGDEYKSFYYRSVHKWYFNQASLSYISEKLGFQNKWIDLKVDNLNVNYFERIPALQRDSPYFYVKFAGANITKIGAADNSTRFKPNDCGVVVCLESRASDKFALYVETEVRTFLQGINITPIFGKLDYYSIELTTLVKLVIAFISSHAEIKSRIRSINASSLF